MRSTIAASRVRDSELVNACTRMYYNLGDSAVCLEIATLFLGASFRLCFLARVKAARRSYACHLILALVSLFYKCHVILIIFIVQMISFVSIFLRTPITYTVLR